MGLKVRVQHGEPQCTNKNNLREESKLDRLAQKVLVHTPRVSHIEASSKKDPQDEVNKKWCQGQMGDEVLLWDRLTP